MEGVEKGGRGRESEEEREGKKEKERKGKGKGGQKGGREEMGLRMVFMMDCHLCTEREER